VKFVLSLFILISATFASAGEFKLTSNLSGGKSIPADYYGNLFGCTAKGKSPELEWINRMLAVSLLNSLRVVF
jgi:hypothetical protein